MSDIKDLIAELIANPSKVHDKSIENKLPEVVKALSQYKAVTASSQDNKKCALMSYTNLQEEYMKRYLMTSLVGFVYRMFDEFSVPEEFRTWDDVHVAEKVPADVRAPFTYEKLKSLHEQLGIALPLIQKYTSDKQRAEMTSLKESLSDTPDENAIAVADHEALQHRDNLNRVLYGVNALLIRFGRDAELKFDSTSELVKDFDDVAADVVHVRQLLHPPPERRTLPDNIAKNIVKSFLDQYFEYNPDEHVKRSTQANAKGKKTDIDDVLSSDTSLSSENKLLMTRVANETDGLIQFICKNRERYNAYMYILNDCEESGDGAYSEKVIHIINNSTEILEKFKELQPIYELVDRMPPQDTFFRWDYYSEVNMEELRQEVARRYNDRPALDIAFIVHEILEGTDEEIKGGRNNFMNKYGEEVGMPVYEMNIGKWVILSHHKENRKEIDFLNRETEVLKRIFDRIEEDKKIGGDLMRRRTDATRKKNAKEGPEANIMREYRRDMQRIAAAGSKRPLTENEELDMKNLQHAILQQQEVNDVPDDSIQVNVFTHNASTGQFEKSSFFTESEAPPSESS